MTGYIPRRFTCPRAVTHRSSNRAQCRLSTLIEDNALTTTLCQHPRLVIIFTARCYAERGYATVCRLSVRLSVCLSVCSSVCLSVTFMYRDYIGWNYSKIISRPNNLRLMHELTPKWAIWCNGNNPKITVEYGWGQFLSRKPAISPK